MSVQAFYDELAPLYHLVYENWEATVARQGMGLASLIGDHWGASTRTVHDAAVGIGTQALGLLALGFRVTGSDHRDRAGRMFPLRSAGRWLPRLDARLRSAAAFRNGRGATVRRARLGGAPLSSTPGLELAGTAI
jgi:hypothetical protein